VTVGLLRVASLVRQANIRSGASNTGCTGTGMLLHSRVPDA
jgi:hypothetical protein